MISLELLRRYPFFSGFSHAQLSALAEVGNELTFDAGHHFFYEGETLDHFSLVITGQVAINVGVTDRNAKQKLAELLVGHLITTDVTVSTVGPLEIFGWSALIPPHQSSAGARALTDCVVVSFDCERLLQLFTEDSHFAYLLTTKVAQVIRKRLRDRLIETLTLRTPSSVVKPIILTA